jgi:hypothetical protein
MRKRGNTRGLLALIMVFMSGLVGCAPMQVNLSESEYRPSPEITGQRPKVTSYSVINRAPSTHVENKIFGTTQMPIETPEPLSQTVTSDLTLLLAQTLATDPASGLSVIVTLRRADAFWPFGGIDKAPIAGLFTAGRTRTFTMDIVLSAVLLKNGQNVNNYQLNKQVTAKGKLTDIEASYERLVANYRNTVLPELIQEFILKIPNASSK